MTTDTFEILSDPDWGNWINTDTDEWLYIDPTYAPISNGLAHGGGSEINGGTWSNDGFESSFGTFTATGATRSTTYKHAGTYSVRMDTAQYITTTTGQDMRPYSYSVSGVGTSGYRLDFWFTFVSAFDKGTDYFEVQYLVAGTTWTTLYNENCNGLTALTWYHRTATVLSIPYADDVCKVRYRNYANGAAEYVYIDDCKWNVQSGVGSVEINATGSLNLNTTLNIYQNSLFYMEFNYQPMSTIASELQIKYMSGSTVLSTNTITADGTDNNWKSKSILNDSGDFVFPSDLWVNITSVTGNWRVDDIVLSMTPDTDKPTSSVGPYGANYWGNSHLRLFTGTASDIGGSGINNTELWYRYSADNISFGAWTYSGYVDTTNWGIPAWLFDYSTHGGNGYYEFYSIAEDNASNIESAPGSADRITGYDSGLPSSSVTASSTYQWFSPFDNPWTITATASDALSGISQVTLWYRYSTDNSSWDGWTDYGTDTTFPYTYDFDFNNGTGYYEFYIIAKDHATNTETAPGSRDEAFQYDEDDPVSTLFPIIPYLQTTPSVFLIAAASDTGSGLYSVEFWWRYSTDNSSFGAWFSYWVDDTFPYQVLFAFPNGTGYYEFFTMATDNASNTESFAGVDALCRYNEGYNLAFAIINTEQTAALDSALFSASNEPLQGIYSIGFGVLVPTNGTLFTLLSTGIAGQPPTTGGVIPGSERGNWYGPQHPGIGDPYDYAELNMTLTVPAAMHYISIDFMMMTTEYPEYIGTIYSDIFTAICDSPSKGLQTTSLTTNDAGIDLTSDNLTGTGYDVYATDGNPAGIDTLTNIPNGAADAGACSLRTIGFLCSPGETLTISFKIIDHGDNQFDTQVFLDNLTFYGAVTPATPTFTLLYPTDGEHVDMPQPTITGIPHGTFGITITSYFYAYIKPLGYILKQTNVSNPEEPISWIDTEATEYDTTYEWRIILIATGGTTANVYTYDFYVKLFHVNFTWTINTTISKQVVFTDHSYSYDNTSNVIDAWFWDFGDGQTSDERNPIHYYYGNADFNVTLTVEHLSTHRTDSTTNTILLYVVPTPTTYLLNLDWYNFMLPMVFILIIIMLFIVLIAYIKRVGGRRK